MTEEEKINQKKRDFINIMATTLGLGAVAISVAPLLSSLSPSADILALSSVEINIAEIQVGQSITKLWRGKPIFITHRTPTEIKEAENAKYEEMRDPEADSKRVKPGKANWLIMIGICTH